MASDLKSLDLKTWGGGAGDEAGFHYLLFSSFSRQSTLRSGHFSLLRQLFLKVFSEDVSQSSRARSLSPLQC